MRKVEGLVSYKFYFEWKYTGFKNCVSIKKGSEHGRKLILAMSCKISDALPITYLYTLLTCLNTSNLGVLAQVYAYVQIYILIYKSPNRLCQAI